MSSSLVFLVPLALLLGGMALFAFLWSLRNGQYDDLDGAAQRVLLDEEDGDLADRPAGRGESPGGQAAPSRSDQPERGAGQA